MLVSIAIADPVCTDIVFVFFSLDSAKLIVWHLDEIAVGVGVFCAARCDEVVGVRLSRLIIDQRA